MDWSIPFGIGGFLLGCAVGGWQISWQVHTGKSKDFVPVPKTWRDAVITLQATPSTEVERRRLVEEIVVDLSANAQHDVLDHLLDHGRESAKDRIRHPVDTTMPRGFRPPDWAYEVTPPPPPPEPEVIYAPSPEINVNVQLLADDSISPARVRALARRVIRAIDEIESGATEVSVEEEALPGQTNRAARTVSVTAAPGRVVDLS